MSRLDIIVFGASGYTGTFVVRELAKIFLNEKLTWGIAGRSINKLKSVLNTVSNEESSVALSVSYYLLNCDFLLNKID